MISTILIDDEPLARAIIKEYADAFPQLNIVQECNDGFEGLKAIMQHKPQLIFLDVQMPKINGFEIMNVINRNDLYFTGGFYNNPLALLR